MVNRILPTRLLLVFSLALLAPSASAQESPLRKTASPPPPTPWNLEQLRKVPHVEWKESHTTRSLFYAGEPFEGKPTRVFACYATPGTLSGDPSKDKNLPGIVLVHGGGGKAFPRWAELWASRGYAAIAMDLSGSGNPHQPLTDAGPRQNNDAIFRTDAPATDQWSYHAVAAVIRAHSLLRSFPEVDAERTAITGISWGGYLTCIVAGLDDRFKAAVPVYGCGFLSDNSCWLGHFERMSVESRNHWVRLWDPSQYVGSATMPMLFVNGGKDFAYPPDSHARTYALVKSRKNLCFLPDLRHGHVFDNPPAIEHFIRQHLEGGAPLALIAEPEVKINEVSAQVESRTKLIKAELHYTTSPIPGAAKSRVWTTLPAHIAGHAIHAELPAAQPSIWFLNVTDERQVTTSSRLMIAGEPAK
jgi:cephalosporin-C deacetylase-like acetyl esterase